METNQALKLRYDALLTRLPVSMTSGSSSTSPVKASPIKDCPSDTDQWTTDEEVFFPIPSTTPSPMRSRANSVATPDTFSPGHQRRITASPAAVLTLQETNNDLIVELTRLRSETDAAQVDGAHRLRKLEQEIKGLKAELEMTQRTNAELEERMHTQRNNEQEILREKRLKPLRNPRTSGVDADTPQLHKDFAPPPELQKRLRRASSSASISDAGGFEPTCPNYEESVASVAPSARSSFSAVSAGEYAVVAQLYRKVEELQTANRELSAKNRTTKEQLSRAERNSLELKKVYDAIRVELGSDADTEDAPSASSSDDESAVLSRGTSRFVTPKTSIRSIDHFATRSNGRNEFVLSRRNSKAKRPEWQATDMDKTGSSTSRTIGNKNMLYATRLAKTRKPLPPSLLHPPSGSAEPPRSLPCSRSSSPIPPESPVLLTPRSQTPTVGLSKRGIARHSPVTIPRTLGSELADRLNSMDMKDSLDLDRESCITALIDDDDLPAVAELRRLLDEDEFLNSVSPATSISVKPSIVLNSPGSTSKPARMNTPSPARYPSAFLDTPVSFSTLAQRRISRREGALRRMVSTRENEFFSVAESIAEALAKGTFNDGNESGEEDQHSSSTSLSPQKGVLRQLRRQSEEIMLELWIYLQFVVVVGFFLYTMYKRGPRDVMGIPRKK